MTKSRWLLVILLIVILCGLGAGGYWWWLKQQEGPSRPIVECLPADTILFAHVPDGTASYQRYMQSNLHKICASKEISGLITQLRNEGEKQGSAVGFSSQEGWKWLKQLTACMDGESFISMGNPDWLQLMSSPRKDIPLIFGLRPKSGKKTVETFINEIKTGIQEQGTKPKQGTGNVAGVSYEWVETPIGFRIYQAYTKGWALTALGEEALKTVITNLNAKVTGESLKDSASFMLVKSRIAQDADAYVYLDYNGLLQGISKQMDKMGQGVPNVAKMKAKIERLRQSFGPFGMSAKFADGVINDDFFFSMPAGKRPDLGKTYSPCAFKTLQYTGADSLIYLSQNFDTRKQYEYIISNYREDAPDLDEHIDKAKEFLTAQGVDLDKNILDALNGEIAFCLDWPASSPFPEPAVFLELSSAESFKPTIDWLVRMLQEKQITEGDQQVPMCKVEDVEISGQQAKVVKFTKQLPVSPTYVTADNFAVIFLTQQGAAHFLGNKGKPTVKEAPLFKSACPAGFDGCSSLMFCDMQNLVDRTYATGKPYLMLATAFVPEARKAMANVTLPEKLSFTKDLGAWAATTKVNAEGIETKSRSSIGMPILPLAGIGVGAAVLIPQFSKTQKMQQSGSTKPVTPPQPPAETVSEPKVEQPKEEAPAEAQTEEPAQTETKPDVEIAPAPAAEEPATESAPEQQGEEASPSDS